jgi:phage-related baseplate assembly protein
MTINANRFISPTINPETLPPPDAVEVLDQETILADRMADFQERADQAGFPYDVGALEFDPIKIDQEAHAHREMLMRARVNSAVRSVMPAYAKGTDLDAIVARSNVARIELVPADPDAGTAAVVESDQSLLIRYLTSFAAPAAGSSDGYIYWSLVTFPDARDIAVLGPSVHGQPGRAAVYLLSADGQATDSDTVQAVREVLQQNHIKPLTDDLVVASASIVEYTIVLNIMVPRGPAPAVIRDAVEAAVQKVADARYAIGAKVYVNSLEGAAYAGNVLRVQRTSPAADIDPGPSGAAFCTSITVNVEVET